MTKKPSQLPGYRLRLLRQQLARRKANLLDPNWGDGRLPGVNTKLGTSAISGGYAGKRFPVFYPGMSTAAYIEAFQRINHHTRPSTTLPFTHRAGPAPMLDPSYPEVVEEVLK